MPARTLLPTDAGRAPVPPCDDRRLALALSFAAGVGAVTYRQWATADGGADAAWRRRVAPAAAAAALAGAERALSAGEAAGATLLLLGDSEYPGELLELPDPPPALWCLGDRALLAEERPRVAIVGTRAVTPYGRRASSALADALAGAGVVVVSGMARGVDGAAHEAALDAGGATVAVLGSGVDVAYPRLHATLHRRIVRDGLVVSEESPGSAPTPGAFPRRNRIIAALSRATIVVEAGVRSGALITAASALELGREVGAVPGPIDADESAGANALLRDGAAVIAEPADALALVDLRQSAAAGGERSQASAPPAALGPDALAVWQALARPAADLDALVERVPMPVARCLAALTSLELAARAECSPIGDIRRR